MSTEKSKVLKFLLSGGLAAVTEMSAYILLNYAFSDKYIGISQTLSYVCGFLVSFILQRNWAFNSNGGVKSDLSKYLVLALANIVLTNIVLYILVEVLRLDANLAKLIVMAMVAIWNYLILSRLIFKDASKDKKKVEE